MIVLEKQHYPKLTHALNGIPFNTLFARAVIEQTVNGQIFADNTEAPKTFYVLHPYGMSLLLGDCQNEEFNKEFKEYALNVNKSRSKAEWMQAYPAGWNDVLKKLFENSIVASHEKTTAQSPVELNTRINFKFNRSKFFKSRVDYQHLKLVKVDAKIFDAMKGSVVPMAFWNNAHDFLSKGAGFSLLIENEIAATAFSSFVQGSQFELGIETLEKYRGTGLAQSVCTALIDYCIEHEYEPIWACRLENVGSYKLALKLGFEPVLEIPYYRLGIS